MELGGLWQLDCDSEAPKHTYTELAAPGLSRSNKENPPSLLLWGLGGGGAGTVSHRQLEGQPGGSRGSYGGV